MKIIGVISAKLTDTGRVPNKILLPLAGKSMLEHHIERMKAVEGLCGIFVATSRWPGNEQCVPPICEKCGVGWLAGSENDIISRYISLCERELAHAVLRIQCDSPLFDIDSSTQLVKTYNDHQKMDYVYIRNVPYMCSISTELITFEALKKAHTFYQGPAVTLPIWENFQHFKCRSVDAGAWLVRPEYSLEVDTPEDYVVISHIYGALYQDKPIPTEEAFKWLDHNLWIQRLNESKEYSTINRRFVEAQKKHATS